MPGLHFGAAFHEGHVSQDIYHTFTAFCKLGIIGYSLTEQLKVVLILLYDDENP